MTAAERLWVEYTDSIEGKERYDVISEFHNLCAERAGIHFGDAVEYLLLIHAGEVAPMPDVSAWA